MEREHKKLSSSFTHTSIPQEDLESWKRELEDMPAEERVKWALEKFKEQIVLSSSFGAQAAVMLHMVTQQKPEIPIILIDTGYLFPETYQFIDDLVEKLSIQNLCVHRSELSTAWQEARYGKLWEQGEEGITHYNTINKVEPMRQALNKLGATAWFSGIRRDQASTRMNKQTIEEQNGRLKIHPIIDWSDHDIYLYLKKFDLPYHPLWEKGYVSIGDTHSTSRLQDGMSAEETRGIKRECGLHFDV